MQILNILAINRFFRGKGNYRRFYAKNDEKRRKMRTVGFIGKRAKKQSVIFTIWVCLLLILTVSATTLAVAVERSKPKKLRVVVDAGHGGPDGGVVGITSGVKESEINLEIAFLLGEFLSSAGVEVVYTRTTDGLVSDDVDAATMKQKDMAARKKIIDKSDAALVVSVHQNFYPAKYRRGSQVFFAEHSEEGKKLAAFVQKPLNENVNSETVGRSFSPLAGDYYIVNCTELPSVIVECGFLSSPEDEKLLLSFDFRRKIAYNVCCGILNYLSDAQISA